MNNDTKHLKSKISVIIIGVLVSLYALLYIGFCIFMYQDLSHPIMLLYGLIPICLLIGIIVVVRMRIKEITDGELDEARKY